MNAGRRIASWIVGVSFAVTVMGGCSRDAATALVVDVASDMTVPGELDGVRLLVRGADAEPLVIPFLLSDRLEAGKRMLPLRIVLFPRGDRAREIEIRLAGEWGGKETVSQDARVAFQPGKARVLSMFLAARCRGVTCADASTTCGVDGCTVPRHRTPVDLPAFDPGRPPARPDAAVVVDGGVEVATDRAAGDVAIDPPIDAAADVAADAAVDPGVDPHVDASVDPAVDPRVDLPVDRTADAPVDPRPEASIDSPPADLPVVPDAPAASLGSPCSTSPECASGHCVDGTCCGAVSCGTCETCGGSSPGACTKVQSAQDSDSCSGANICDATGTCITIPSACATNAECGVCRVCNGAPAGTCGPAPRNTLCNGGIDQCDGEGNCINCTNSAVCDECCNCVDAVCVPV